MQIMPVTARHFKIDQRRLSDPEVNITLAAKLIKSIDESLGFAEGTPDESRLSIILAAYNCGIGTVRDARRLARAEGENPDSWEAVSALPRPDGDGDYMCVGDLSPFQQDTARRSLSWMVSNRNIIPIGKWSSDGIRAVPAPVRSMEDCRPAGILKARGEPRVFRPDIRRPRRLF